jgi:hypothetical protein
MKAKGLDFHVSARTVPGEPGTFVPCEGPDVIPWVL